MKLIRGIVITCVLLTGCSAQNAAKEEGTTSTSSPSAVVASATPSPAVTDEASAPLVNGTDGGTTSNPPASASASKEYMETARLHTTFGFADAEGKHILMTREDDSEMEQMKSLNTAVGNNGQILTLTFEKWQAGSENSNGRESANNFANLQGVVYAVDEGGATPDETYYLADSAEFKLKSLLEIQPAAEGSGQLTADDPLRKSISAAKQREIKAAWKLADLPPDRGLYLVQFVRQNKNMLFSLVVVDGGKLKFMDYPAVVQEDEYSVWRVDDGGEVLPEMFSLLFAAETTDGLLLGLNWWGAEGINSFFLSQDGDTFIELDIQYGRYTSPL
ncbi:hypothetical protein NYE80_13935 [Paenibacillus sp. FSL H7-0357]|uniref:hypothetical protein n=1 Tax=unclassified Paenibacillus TaxID=185978 RepID=UPI000689D041|nr:hypothetical protein [Paenibacillus sp. FSL H7-0357]